MLRPFVFTSMGRSLSSGSIPYKCFLRFGKFNQANGRGGRVAAVQADSVLETHAFVREKGRT